MLYRYGVVLKNPMLPMILRERASIALGAFPGNSIIFSRRGKGSGDNEMDVGKTKERQET